MDKENDWQMIQIICSSEVNLTKKFIKTLLASLSSGQMTKQKFEILSILKEKNKELPSEFESVCKLGKIFCLLEDSSQAYSVKYDAIKEMAEVLEEQKECLKVDKQIVDIFMSNIKEHGGTKLVKRLFEILINIAENDCNMINYIDWKIIVSAIIYQKLENYIIQLIKIALKSQVQLPPGILSKLLSASDQDEVAKLLQGYRDVNGEFSEEDSACHQFLSVNERNSIKTKEELNDFINSKNFK
jgi:hypothetical protein